MSNNNDLLTVKEVADMLSVSEYTIREYLKANRFKGAFKLSSTFGWRIPKASVDDFIKQQQGVA